MSSRYQSEENLSERDLGFQELEGEGCKSGIDVTKMRQKIFCMSILLLVLVALVVLMFLLNLLAFKSRSDGFEEKRTTRASRYDYPFHSLKGKRAHSGFVTLSEQKSVPEIRYSKDDNDDIFMIYQRKSEYENIYNLRFDLRCCKKDGDQKCFPVLRNANFEYACETDDQACIDKGTEAFLNHIKMFSFEIFETEHKICSKDNEFFHLDLLDFTKVTDFLYECVGTCFSITWEEFEKSPKYDEILEHVEETYTRIWGYRDQRPPTGQEVLHMVQDLYETDVNDCVNGIIHEEFSSLKFDYDEALSDFVQTVHIPYCKYFTGLNYGYAYYELDWESYRNVICHPKLATSDCYVKFPNIGFLRNYDETDIYDHYNRTSL